MAETSREREERERQERLAHMRDQISSGELVVRQMTASERTHWDERTAAFDRHATPDERTRREAAWKKRERRKRHPPRQDRPG